MRLCDLDNLKRRVKKSTVSALLKAGMQVFIETEKTINPENLPIVQELREQLAKVTAERDQAVEKLTHIKILKREGKLIELPCKAGDDLYWVNSADMTIRKEERGIYAVAILADGSINIVSCDLDIDPIGTQYACITGEQAEEVLAQMKAQKMMRS